MITSTDSRFDSIVEAYTDPLHAEQEAHEETRERLAEALLELERLREHASCDGCKDGISTRICTISHMIIHRGPDHSYPCTRTSEHADPISALLSAVRRLGSPAMVFVHRIARNPVTVSIHVDTDEQLQQLADTLRLSAVSAHRGEHSEWTEASRTTDTANVTVYGPQRRV